VIQRLQGRLCNRRPIRQDNAEQDDHRQNPYNHIDAFVVISKERKDETEPNASKTVPSSSSTTLRDKRLTASTYFATPRCVHP
jgi:hypothetical protein